MSRNFCTNGVRLYVSSFDKKTFSPIIIFFQEIGNCHFFYISVFYKNVPENKPKRKF